MPVALVVVLASSAILCVLALAMRREVRPSAAARTPQTRAQESAADDVFIFEVLERVLARTVDANRYLDALLLGILASDVALIVLVVEKTTVYRNYLLAGTAAIAGIVSAALLLSVFVFEAPDPKTFLREAISDVRRARF
ncbi:MAG: hypothetical protein JO036_13700 [Candidatus Eremiobacteraeota bacterium]|nr:hypothetical protein [Candidatus Eremiobacteraeota bacterium]